MFAALAGQGVNLRRNHANLRDDAATHTRRPPFAHDVPFARERRRPLSDVEFAGASIQRQPVI